MAVWFSIPVAPFVRVGGRISSGLSRQGKRVAALIFLAMVAVSVAVKYWHVTLPLAVLLGVLVLLGKREQRRQAAPRTPPSRPQASVSNRR